MSVMCGGFSSLLFGSRSSSVSKALEKLAHTLVPFFLTVRGTGGGDTDGVVKTGEGRGLVDAELTRLALEDDIESPLSASYCSL